MCACVYSKQLKRGFVNNTEFFLNSFHCFCFDLRARVCVCVFLVGTNGISKSDILLGVVVVWIKYGVNIKVCVWICQTNLHTSQIYIHNSYISRCVHTCINIFIYVSLFICLLNGFVFFSLCSLLLFFVTLFVLLFFFISKVKCQILSVVCHLCWFKCKTWSFALALTLSVDGFLFGFLTFFFLCFYMYC